MKDNIKYVGQMPHRKSVGYMTVTERHSTVEGVQRELANKRFVGCYKSMKPCNCRIIRITHDIVIDAEEPFNIPSSNGSIETLSVSDIGL